MLELPILAILRASGDAALLAHALTPDERRLFLKMDSASLQLPEDTELEGFHERVVGIGAEVGLSRAQSIALWTRTTFSLFEPEEYAFEPLEATRAELESLEPPEEANHLELRDLNTSASEGNGFRTGERKP